MEAPISPPLRAPDKNDRRRQASGGWPGIPIGRILGLDVRIDVSWLFIFALVAMSMVGSFSQSYPGLRSGPIWVAAITTTLIFFVCLLVHEISHSLVAKA